MAVLSEVELGIPFTGWPVRSGTDYEFALEVVSVSLRDDLLSWAQVFNENVDDLGWRSEVMRAQHREEGERLRARLQAELGHEYLVTLSPIFPLAS